MHYLCVSITYANRVIAIYRIRLAIMQHIPLLAKQLGKEFFTEQLVNLCVGWLGDSISTIREAAAENLKVRDER